MLINHLYVRRQDAIEVQDPVTGRNTRYETFFPNNSSPYSKAARDRLQGSWIPVGNGDEHVGYGGALPAEEVTSIDNDDEWEDTAEHHSSGVRDILVTGKVGRHSILTLLSAETKTHSALHIQTTQLQGDAWGHFTILGRVSTQRMQAKDGADSIV